MRAVIQRVLEASVTIDGKKIASIGNGLLVLVGIAHEDTVKDIEYLTKKILNLRIFSDDAGKFNYNVQEVEGAVLLVSQFTLCANCSKGNRPSFVSAMVPEKASVFFNEFIQTFKKQYQRIEIGQFGADMKVQLINDGPVTIVLDSE